jgi:hypothetical protein
MNVHFFFLQFISVAMMAVALPASAELQLTDVTLHDLRGIEPVSADLGRPHRIRATVSNSDAFNAENFSIKFFAGTAVVCRIPQDATIQDMTIPPLGTQTYECPWTPIFDGAQTVSASVTPHGLPEDSKFSVTRNANVNVVGPIAITKKVFVLEFNPKLADGKYVTESTFVRPAGQPTGPWNSRTTEQRAQEIMDFFRRTDVSGGKINYVLVNPGFTPEERFPPLVGAPAFTETTYRNCLQNTATCPKQEADLRWVLKHYRVCERFNAGELDELWIYGGPFFQFDESRLAGAGPEGYWYNSTALTGTSCRKLLPIMGFSYEEWTGFNFLVPARSVHNFTHRMESSMDKVYEKERAAGSLSTAWHTFYRVRADSSMPVPGVSGCGSGHYPANATNAATQEYSYDFKPNVMPAQYSFCDEYFYYPNMRNLTTVKKLVDCWAWGCREVGYPAYAGTFGVPNYYAYWFNHFPRKSGMAPDGKLNDWLAYLIDPNIVISTTAKPDFHVTALTVIDPTTGGPPTTIEVGRTYKIYTDVQNASTRHADGGISQIEIRVNGTAVCPNLTMPIMWSQQRQGHNCTWVPTASGTAAITAVADATDTIWESNEANNTRSMNVSVIDRRADLTIRAVWVTDSAGNVVQELTPSTTYKVHAAVRNIGVATVAVGTFKDDIRRVFNSTTTILACSGANSVALANQQEYVRTCTFVSPSTAQSVITFRANADFENTIAEQSEANNTKTHIVSQGYE